MADLQEGVGDLGLGEGSFEHAALHGLVGCAAAEALDGNCASGAAAGIAQSIFAGLQEGAPQQQEGQSDEDFAAVYNAWKDDVAGQAKLLGAVVGYTTSGGQAVNVTNAASIADSGARHNYLNHTQRARVETLIDELNSCRVTRDCSLAQHDAMVTELRQLQEMSSQQTIAMLAACENGPSPACAAHVAAAAEFEEWAWYSGYNDMGRIVGFTPSMFQARTAGAVYDLDNDVNLDLIALELARGIQSGTLAPDVAAEQLLAALQRQDGGMKVLGGAGQTLSAGACFVTKLTCVLGLANAAVGVDRAYEGTVTLISGENQLSAIEAGLVATGYSATEAAALRDDIEAGLAIVTVGVGGAYFVYRGGIAVAQLGKVDGLPVGVPNRTGSAVDGIYGDIRPMTDEFPELAGVNPHYVDGAGPGVNTNCVSCVNATVDRLTGRNPDAVAGPSNGYGVPNDLNPSAPWGFRQPTSPANVTNELLSQGDGAISVVGIQQSGTDIEHVIVGVNRGGTVHYIDPQLGAIVDLQPNLTVIPGYN